MKRTVWAKAGTYKVDGVETTRNGGWTILSGSYSQISQSYLDLTGEPLKDPNSDIEWKRGRGGNFYKADTLGGATTLVDNNSGSSEHWDND